MWQRSASLPRTQHALHRRCPNSLNGINLSLNPTFLESQRLGGLANNTWPHVVTLRDKSTFKPDTTLLRAICLMPSTFTWASQACHLDKSDTRARSKQVETSTAVHKYYIPSTLQHWAINFGFLYTPTVKLSNTTWHPESHIAETDNEWYLRLGTYETLLSLHFSLIPCTVRSSCTDPCSCHSNLNSFPMLTLAGTLLT